MFRKEPYFLKRPSAIYFSRISLFSNSLRIFIDNEGESVKSLFWKERGFTEYTSGQVLFRHRQFTCQNCSHFFRIERFCNEHFYSKVEHLFPHLLEISTADDNDADFWIDL
jgi:hypothetical protein